MNETLQIITTLLGGLALFIFGMNFMSDGLQRAAGEKMRRILSVITTNPFVGVLAGAAVTAVLQSSSATTVLVIGFVSAGLMKLPQAISIILGANIGTTITAQLIAFKIGDYAWIFVTIGFIMYFFFKKRERVKQTGQILFGFGILFVGIGIMSDVMTPLASSAVFEDLIMKVKDVPVLGVFVGMLMTLLVQSSSATIAVLQNIASTAGPDGVTSILGLQGALPILFGDNIGTTITALLASIGASLDAKRTALSHVIFNVTGTLIFIGFIPKIALFISAISPSGHEADVISRQIANAHLIFNLTNTLIFLPFVGLLAVFVTKLIPGHNRSILPGEPLYIDKRTVDRPAFAINLAVKELGRLGSYTEEMLELSRKAFIEGKKECAKKVFEIENYVNELEDHIVSYLSTILTSGRVVERDADEVSYLLHVAADIEHIGDHCINITELAVSKHENKYEFSGIAYEEISDMYDQTEAILKNALLSLEDNDKKKAAGVFEKEKLLNETEKKLRRHHLKRLNEKTCSPEFTFIYMDTAHNMEKIGDFCQNIAEAVCRSTYRKQAVSNDYSLQEGKIPAGQISAGTV